MKDIITYHKWDKKSINYFLSTCNENLNIEKGQIYMPFFSLYFHIHNTKNANKIIDLNRRYFINSINNIIKDSTHNSNKEIDCFVYDKKHNVVFEKEIFAKCIPILDPIHTMMNNYNLKQSNNLPSNYTYNTHSKINNMNNSCYMEVLFSYITSELTIKNILPSFPIYYGSINGISKDYKIDITEEYKEFSEERWFHKYIDEIFSIDLYISDDDEYCEDGEGDDESINNSDEFVSNFKDMPVQYIFIEKLEGTLEDFLIENINIELIRSCLFQITFALLYLQKYYKFTHNDLHINNIMYKKTDKTYLYYKFNNKYFRVPTHGYLFSIIDYGRCIFEYKNKVYYNDVFSKYGEAEGQYTYPIPNIDLYKSKKYEEKIYPNYSFDMCRLSTTILEELDNLNILNSELRDFLNSMVIDCNNNNIYINKTENFDLYINIAKYACNGIPNVLILNDYFNKYTIKKKIFPLKNFYKC
tara:strand:- start:594 stop:2006 length:1413 start_codon:yes stop_codon:yes gene_type:complete